jgi:type IV pilus assembly protein PilA
MLTSIKQRLDHDDDEGFTLIELMVVVLIIAILLAIAIPTFLGARNTANARAAQSDLRNALTAEQTTWTNTQAFATDLSATEPSIKWSTTAAANPVPHTVVVTISDNANVVVLTSLGKDGSCWTIAQVNDPAAPNTTATPNIPNDGTYYTKTVPNAGVCGNPAAPIASADTTTTAGSSTATAGTYYASF